MNTQDAYFTMFGDQLPAPPTADFERQALKLFDRVPLKSRTPEPMHVAVSPSASLLVRHATTVAIDLARVGISPQDAVSHVSVRFALTPDEATACEARVQAATTPQRVRARSGVAIGWARPGVRGWKAEHDRYGVLDGVWATAELAVAAVRRADGGV